jgi:hypothetical protein
VVILSDEGGSVFNVCHDHFVMLWKKQKLTDFVVNLHGGKCQLVGCSVSAVRRVLVIPDEVRSVREIRVLPDGSLWEEGITNRWMP